MALKSMGFTGVITSLLLEVSEHPIFNDRRGPPCTLYHVFFGGGKLLDPNLWEKNTGISIAVLARLPNP